MKDLQLCSMMKVLSVLLIAGLASGCLPKKGESLPGPKQGEALKEAGQEAKADLKVTGHGIRDYAYAQKAEFVAEMQKDMVVIQAELDRLSAKVEESNAETKEEAINDLAAVRLKLDQAKRQLEEAGTATESNWEIVKAEWSKIHVDLKESFDKSRAWLSEKIAP
jgi:hypothetical protein